MKFSILWVAFVCAAYNPLFAQKWNQSQKITTIGNERRLINECGRSGGDQFGNEVDLDSNRMAVGAFNKDDDTGLINLFSSGAVYIYQRVGGQWQKRDKIHPPKRYAVSGETFGYSISMKGDWMFIGAPRNDKDTSGANKVANSGAIYVYRLQNCKWNFHQKLVAPDRDEYDFFGQKIDLGIHFAIVGAYYEDDDSSENNPVSFSGSAYIYKFSNGYWVLDKKLTNKNRTLNDNFGYSVGVYDSVIVVGATGSQTNASNTNSLSGAGAVYIYKNFSGNWIQIQKIVPSDRAVNDQFGYSIAYNGTTLVVGSQKSNAGRIYFFQRSGKVFTEYQKISSKDISIGDKFSIDIKLRGDLCLVGASEEQHDTSGLNASYACGSAYLFKLNNGVWSQIKKLVSNQRASTRYFGTAVAISDSSIVVASPGSVANSEGKDWVNGTGTGAVHTYKLDTTNKWVHAQKTVISDYPLMDYFGNSVSIRDSIAVIGAPNEDSDADNMNEKYDAGAAYIYKKQFGRWKLIQKITPHDRRAFDQFGLKVSAGNGFVFVSAPYSQLDSAGSDSLFQSGSVYVFRDSSGTYVEMKKLVAFDRSQTDQFGYSLDNIGQTLVVGSISNSKDTLGVMSTYYVGAVYIYELNSNKWQLKQKLKPKDGQVNDYYGYSVSLDSNILAIGAMFHSLDSLGNNKLLSEGAVYLYRKSNGRYHSFQKITSDLRTGSSNFGASVDLSGKYLVVGASNDSKISGYTSTGSAYVYKLNNNHFYKIQRLNSDFKQNYSLFGNSVAIDKRSLYVTCYPETYKNGTDSFPNGGYVYAYRKTSADTWTRYDKFTSKDVNSLDWFGYSISADSGSVMIGATLEDQDEHGALTLSDAGAAYFFTPEKCNVGSFFLVSTCDSLVSPSGKYIWRKNGFFSDTFYMPGKCDSVVFVNLQIGKRSQSLNINSCGPFSSPSGKYIWNESGIYNDTLQTYSGCDSILTVNLNMVKVYRDTMVVKSCQNISSPSLKNIYMISGVYSDTLRASTGCDSIVTVEFTKYDSYNKLLNVNTCNIYSSPSGKYLWKQSGKYYDTLHSINGCDSVLNIQLIVYTKKFSKIKLNSCQSMMSPSGRFTMAFSGIYHDTIQSVEGCDSIITIEFEKLEKSFSMYKVSSCQPFTTPQGKVCVKTGIYSDTVSNYVGCDSVVLYDFTLNSASGSQSNLSVCKSYFHPLNGKKYDQSTIIRDTLQTFHGCDSIVIMNLTVNLPEFNVFEDNDSLFSNIELGSVRWSYCDSNFVPVLHTGFNFQPSKNGLYQAELSLNGCKDTSDCVQYTKSSIFMVESNNYNVYPNPFIHSFNIESDELSFEYKVLDASGKLILFGTADNSAVVHLRDFDSGLYLLELKTTNAIYYFKLIKQ